MLHSLLYSEAVMNFSPTVQTCGQDMWEFLYRSDWDNGKSNRNYYSILGVILG